MNGIIGNGLFQRLALTALALAAALACAILWNAATAPAASAQWSTAASLDSCDAAPVSRIRIVEGQPFTLSARVTVHPRSLSGLERDPLSVLDNELWKVRFTVERSNTYETSSQRIGHGNSGTFEYSVDEAPGDGTHMLECVLIDVRDYRPDSDIDTEEVDFTVHPASAQAAPADDHGDTRSSATEISVGSGANGVIGTASDKDYFSFRAERGVIYTIETHIPDGSGVDTLITLYSAGGSRLGYDNNGGNGRASELALIAPSTSAYYVRVSGSGGSTGGYRLSVSYAHFLPRSEIIVPQAPAWAEDVEVGQSFDFELTLVGDGENGGLAVSFPTLTGGSKSSNGWTSSLADVQVVSRAEWDDVSIYKSGDSISHANGSTMRARHLLIESDNSTWGANTRRPLTLRVTPKRAGSFPIMFRSRICADGYSDCSRSPESGSSDQQGYRAFGETVNVVAPPGKPPGKLQIAPIGGLTVYMSSDGTQESGVWSVTYTLTNRVPNGDPIRWAASSDRNWITVAPRSGSLRGGQSATVRVSVNETGAKNLPIGTHTASVTFSNRTNNRDGDSTRTVAFHRLNTNADPAGSEPVETLRNPTASVGYRAAGLEEAWRQMASMSERGLLNPVDIAVIDSNLWRPPTGSSGREGIVLSEFDWDSVNESHVSGATELRDSQHGYAVTSVIAAVNHAKNDAPSSFSVSGVVSSVPGLEYHVDFHPVGVLNFSGVMDRVDPIYVASGIGAAAANSPDVVNMSLGASCASWLENVCTAAMSAGIVGRAQNTIFVMSAGNNNGDARSTWPASIDEDNVITVAATDVTGNSRAFWEGGGLWERIFGAPASNYGPKIDIAAPSGFYAVNPSVEAGGVYNPFTGTSAAAPLVSGVVALLRAIDPDISPGDVKKLLRDTGNPITVCVADGDIALAQCPVGNTEDWIVMNAGSAVKELMRQRGIAPAPAYAPASSSPPRAVIITSNPPVGAAVGRSFDFLVELNNSGGDGERGGISVSFPALTGGSKSSNGYSSARADVHVVDYTGGTGSVSLYKTGDFINSANGSRMSADHLLIESDDWTWNSASNRRLTLRVTPKTAGDLRILVRGWICADGYSDCSRYPASGPPSDQQGYSATIRIANAVASAPADDHGDTRSSATRISAGSSANGVIGTASDKDYFRFQAQSGRVYTIETSIASGSSLDTLVTLYRSNGSVLGVDADSGAGLASKIVWTAPSSAAHYVEVKGIDNTTGGYRLSVSSSAPPPVARLTAEGAGVPASAEAGRSFDFRLKLRNNGGDGARGGISVSFPTLAGGSKSSNGYSSQIADVRVVGYTSGTGNVSLYKSGDSLNHENGSTTRALHLLIESDDATWRASTERVLTLRVTPKRAGELPIRIRGWICADEYSDCSRSPSSGSTSDQQGYKTYAAAVSVSAPADDHGDTRSSATRISSGSSANGVIGTASDKDYFRFQAQSGRVYTIETSIASGSSLDTLVTLYRSNGSVLGVDADSGAGLASKIVWTAPSSAAYYVEVKGIDNSTGGYRLSVSSSAPTQPPVARLSSPDGTSSLAVGRAIEYVVALVNDGGDGEHGGVSVSFPTLTGGSKSSSGYSSSLADVQVVRASGTRNVSLYKSGDSINHANGSTMRARHLLIESDDATWRASAQRLFVLSVTPKRAGELRILVRGWICADGYSGCSRSPSSGSTSDQQGYRVRVITLNAVAPAPQPPAPTAARNGPIAFSSDRDGNYEIYAMNADGSNKTRLTNNSADDWRPSWSPNGRNIAFSCDTGGDHEICTMNADGSFLIYVTNNSDDDTFPSWSPDSQRVVFSSNRSGNYEIYEVHPVTNIGARLANRPNNDDHYPRWSPDGGKIAFYSYYGDNNSEIVVMNADGSGVARLTNNSTEDKQPSWSPDGRRIAFASDRDGDYEIYTMNADGSGVTRLTNNSADDNDPSWSPDGRRIAFASYRDGNYEIYAMNADGSGVTRLTHHVAYDGRPSWGPSTAMVGSAAPQNAADDHGDSRSTATRISAGSSANGVIGTASDADYFSFQAQRGREYTIETSIPSSSDVDTFITLYRSNGSSLGENDDGGGGYASKIVWTAPSSATYYVKVDGLGDSTGGYRLSLSSRAPAQPPVARLEATEFTRSVEVGQLFEFYVELANVGGDGEHGGVSVSFPELTGGSKSSRGYSSSLADVQVVDYTSGTGSVSLYKSGDSLNHANGSRMNARHLLIESDDAAWRSSTERLLALVVTPKRAGELRVLVRGWICADGYSDCSRAPRSGSTSDPSDQQGYKTYLVTVRVVAPTPADDHGDSRSSATRISAGSSANGVIGTASDADYFSFQAQRGREYTIETSIPSSSDVDTEITLYSSGGSRLGGNDDGGDGYASKLVWTAPSSATYYVKVDGLGDSTGGYRLSLSASAPAPAPVAEVRAISIPREATVGQSFEIRVELGNGGGAGNNGGFSISFPSLTGGSTSSGRYASSAADVQTVNASAWDDVSMYKSGDAISSVNGEVPAEHLLVEARDNSWSPSSDRALRLRVTPKRAGEFPIRIAAWICSAATACSLNPASGQQPTDQQGYSATVRNVTVRPATPADDHGDSRSSATRVSAGASENGVIGTASDSDYFSFRASRSLEYTIQTGIRSGSDVDTFITLYDANGSFVDEDDDGGNGFASKIVWTAPSSATYYVKVEGLGDSTGGYWLSVTERAQAPAPVPNVSRISVPNAATAGRSFDVTVELRNDGGDGERGGISMSFPTLTGGSKSSRDWSSSLADVRVVGYTSGTGNVSLYKSGDSINHSNGSRMSARHLLIESDDSTWRSNTRRVLTLRVTPKRAGELPVKVRGWICADGYSDCSRAPTHGMDDQQGYDAAERTVLVVAPAPADDYGDDRSSAAAMNANSRVSGRIETRGDEDYFSFRAQSGAEYTIETRAPSGLDTIITLYSAQGARLMQDDDDGAGRASKMEWTAPSSGTYYVKVYAHGGAVGAYELSLSETPPPVAGGPVSFRFNWSYSHSRIEVGESFKIEGRIHSVSGSGDRGGVSISFPSLTGGRSDVRRYRSSAADVNVVTSEGMSVFVYAEDEIIDTPGLPDVTARHLLFESDDIRWSSSTDRTLKLRVTPKRAGEIPILIRGWVCANRYLNCARYPSDGSNGSRDQQGQWAVRLNVTVVDPP